MQTTPPNTSFFARRTVGKRQRFQRFTRERFCTTSALPAFACVCRNGLPLLQNLGASHMMQYQTTAVEKPGQGTILAKSKPKYLPTEGS